jgi:hypothetical protein
MKDNHCFGSKFDTQETADSGAIYFPLDIFTEQQLNAAEEKTRQFLTNNNAINGIKTTRTIDTHTHTRKTHAPRHKKGEKNQNQKGKINPATNAADSMRLPTQSRVCSRPLPGKAILGPALVSPACRRWREACCEHAAERRDRPRLAER